MERFWYILSETRLAFTVFRDDFNIGFLVQFAVLLFLKSVHWIAAERADNMEDRPANGWLYSIRLRNLLAFLGVFDYLMIVYAYDKTITTGPTVQLAFGFEYAILITMVVNTTIKLVAMRANSSWENRAVFLLYLEFAIGLIKVMLYAMFILMMVNIYTLPMFVFRRMFNGMRDCIMALSDIISTRRAIRIMNTLYPDATLEELEKSDNVCVVCWEDMLSHAKKLPCGHVFHTICLRSWFQRQQTCPTCRLNILKTKFKDQSQPEPCADGANTVDPNRKCE